MKTNLFFCSLIIILTATSTARGQSHHFTSEPNSSILKKGNHGRNHWKSTQASIPIKISDNRKTSCIRLKSFIRFKNQGWAVSYAADMKSFSLTIQPYKIRNQTKHKSI